MSSYFKQVSLLKILIALIVMFFWLEQLIDQILSILLWDAQEDSTGRYA